MVSHSDAANDTDNWVRSSKKYYPNTEIFLTGIHKDRKDNIYKMKTHAIRDYFL